MITLDEYLHILRAVASLNRFRILNVLYEHNRPIQQKELVEILELPRYTVSRHANILVKAEVVDGWKTLKNVYYTLNKNLKIKSVAAILREYQDNAILKRDLRNLKKLTPSKR